MELRIFIVRHTVIGRNPRNVKLSYIIIGLFYIIRWPNQIYIYSPITWIYCDFPGSISISDAWISMTSLYCTTLFDSLTVHAERESPAGGIVRNGLQAINRLSRCSLYSNNRPTLLCMWYDSPSMCAWSRSGTAVADRHVIIACNTSIHPSF